MYFKDIFQGIAEGIILVLLKYMDVIEGQKFLKRICLDNNVLKKQEIITIE